ncbi:pyrroline-5-carboxylate reductase [Weissella viridescens]|uniref:Pyrroline-5-carboxylate reductase n=1 Tax=Weissella viridescens TaxID=1629 RepID=A0A380P1V6_WEIVI|nr:pyrroline-5-carboxylate reductase [Weissella viridescens]
MDANPEFLIFTTPAAKTPEIMDQFKGIDSDVTVLSVASGVSLGDIQTKFPENPSALVVPNTPVSVNHGTLGVAMGPHVTKSNNIESFLGLLGDVYTVPESEFNILGPLLVAVPPFLMFSCPLLAMLPSKMVCHVL